MSSSPITFKPIDLEATRELCISFRHDSFVASFGPDESTWFEKFDGEKYIDWLHTKINRDPSMAVHVWMNDRIIGQMEFGQKENPRAGYINLYYLAPDYRGQGYSSFLDEYAVSLLKSKGHTLAKLCVSPTNLRALNYYKKNGWIDEGVREGTPVHWMSKEL